MVRVEGREARGFGIKRGGNGVYPYIGENHCFCKLLVVDKGTTGKVTTASVRPETSKKSSPHEAPKGGPEGEM